ncbi:MAG: aminodeoxychorismate synthase component I [Pseudomonadota bacterium]
MSAVSWPRYHALPYRADVSDYFARIQALDWPVWLDSGQVGRYDILAADPVEQLSCSACTADGAIDVLRAALQPGCQHAAGVPFCGGWIGYLSYELGRVWLGRPVRSLARLAPDLRAGLYDWAIVVDHQQRTAVLAGAGQTAQTRRAWDALCVQVMPEEQPVSSVPYTATLTDAGLSADTYARLFDRVQYYLHQGHTYQINLTHRFVARTMEPPWSLYRRLRQLSPAPYGAYLAYPDMVICSNSPEQFISQQGGQVLTRPIKGTRPRQADPVADVRLRTELCASLKDRAENSMIVDLLRNDFARVCRPGSVQVTQLCELHSYATVHHLVSTVVGQLQTGKDALDLLQSCFPGGSVTGAPKKRAVEIIDELEPVSREVYCGSIFRLSLDGNLDSNLCIRTLLHKDHQLYYWAGGGVVTDSECAAEYQESLDKAAAFFALLSVSHTRR